MRRTTGPARIIVVDVEPGRDLIVFRIVRSANQDDPVFLNSLRSNYELGGEPRKVELASTVVHMGISVYLNADLARGTAQKWDKLGDYIAQVRLSAGKGFNYAQTGHRLHLTVWADPVKLRDSTEDITPV